MHSGEQGCVQEVVSDTPRVCLVRCGCVPEFSLLTFGPKTCLCRWRAQIHPDRYQLLQGRAFFKSSHGQNLLFKNITYT